jgi:hypothetical protein
MWCVIGLATRDTIHQNPSTYEKIGFLRDCLTRMDERVRLTSYEQHDHCLGIFVAPEYFFAREGGGDWDGVDRFRSRPVTDLTKNYIVERLRHASADHPGILFFPGTIAWKKPLDRAPGERKRDPATGLRTGPVKTDNRRLKNVVRLLQQGLQGDRMQGHVYGNTQLRAAAVLALTSAGLPVTPQAVDAAIANAALRGALIQAFALPADCFDIQPGMVTEGLQALAGAATQMMRNTSYVLLGGNVVLKYNKRGDFHEAIGERGGTVFQPGQRPGLLTVLSQGRMFTFAVEVCLDHASGHLANDVRQGLAPPQFYVLASAETPNNLANVPVQPNGYFLHASSNANNTTVMQRLNHGFAPLNRWDRAIVRGSYLSYYRMQV